MLFFFNDTATTEIYTLSLHDALPISLREDDPVGDELEDPELDPARRGSVDGAVDRGRIEAERRRRPQAVVPNVLLVGRVVGPLGAAVGVRRLEDVADVGEGDVRIPRQVATLERPAVGRDPAGAALPDRVQDPGPGPTLAVDRRRAAPDHAVGAFQELGGDLVEVVGPHAGPP